MTTNYRRPLRTFCYKQLSVGFLTLLFSICVNFSSAAVAQLKYDFDTVKTWVQENLCQNETQKETVRNLHVFKTVDNVFGILSGIVSPETEIHSSSVKFSKKSKISPLEFDNGKTDDEFVVIKISSAEIMQWKRLRTGDSHFNCLFCL